MKGKIFALCLVLFAFITFGASAERFPGEPLFGNYLSNNSFEKSDGWTLEGAVISTESYYTGIQSLRLTGTDNAQSETLKLQAGKKYELSAFGKVTGNNPLEAYVEFYSDSGTLISTAGKIVFNVNDWLMQQNSFVVPQGTKTAKVKIAFSENNGGSTVAFIDEVAIINKEEVAWGYEAVTNHFSNSSFEESPSLDDEPYKWDYGVSSLSHFEVNSDQPRSGNYSLLIENAAAWEGAPFTAGNSFKIPVQAGKYIVGFYALPAGGSGSLAADLRVKDSEGDTQSIRLWVPSSGNKWLLFSDKLVASSTDNEIYIRFDYYDWDCYQHYKAYFDDLFLISNPNFIAPGAPTQLVAQDLNPREAHLSWVAPIYGANAGLVDHYNIYRATEPIQDLAGLTAIGSVMENQYDDQGLLPHTTYYYVVTAVNENGDESIISNSASVTAFDFPGVGGVVKAGGQIIPNAMISANPDLWVQADAEGAFNLILAPGNYVISVQKPGYRTWTQNIILKAKEQIELNPDLQPNGSTQKPAVPSGLVINNTTNFYQLTLSWAGNGNSYYNVYRSENAGVEITDENLVAVNIIDHSWVDKSVELKKEYYYRIVAVNPDNNLSSAASTEMNAYAIPFSLSGYIKDNATTKPVISAAIVVKDSAGSQYKIFSDLNGYYFVPQLAEGAYEISISKPGYLDGKQTDVQIILEQETVCDILLTPSEYKTIMAIDNLWVSNTVVVPNQEQPLAISFTVSVGANVKVSIYDPNGRIIAEVYDKTVGEGNHTAIWDGTNSNGRPVPAGIYLMVVKADDKLSGFTSIVKRPILVVR